ncbi:hypothetical protein T440DRAFT_524876 [Plenodomus tracheiphilus IPT5]|uniref:F-box domain-containing protein n=1 Tax=Plenodomus tracheiphilus IPT5 TaxID=1408161 RepID=A0A6A7BQL5_9PLEO|nr:hypothetical protein T440DRAFT_524876 [Plenodomus tracheiphilus IPT5]
MATLSSGMLDDAHEIASKIGFLDLPGELRNSVYEYHLAQSRWMSEKAVLASTCRTIRTEIRPMYLPGYTSYVELPYHRVQPFLELFFPESTPEIMSEYDCEIFAAISKVVKETIAIDLK